MNRRLQTIFLINQSPMNKYNLEFANIFRKQESAKFFIISNKENGKKSNQMNACELRNSTHYQY